MAFAKDTHRPDTGSFTWEPLHVAAGSAAPHTWLTESQDKPWDLQYFVAAAVVVQVLAPEGSDTCDPLHPDVAGAKAVPHACATVSQDNPCFLQYAVAAETEVHFPVPGSIT